VHWLPSILRRGARRQQRVPLERPERQGRRSGRPLPAGERGNGDARRNAVEPKQDYAALRKAQQAIRKVPKVLKVVFIGFSAHVRATQNLVELNVSQYRNPRRTTWSRTCAT